MRQMHYKKRLAVILSLVLLVSLFPQPVVAKTVKKPTVSKMITVDPGDVETINIKANGYSIKEVYAFPIGDEVFITHTSNKAIKVKGLQTGMAKVRIFIYAQYKKRKRQLFDYYTDVAILEANTTDPSLEPTQTAKPTPTPVKTPEPTPTEEPTPSGPCNIVINNIQATRAVSCSTYTAVAGDTFTVTVTPTSGKFGTFTNPYPSIRATFYTGYTYENLKTVGSEVKEEDICQKTFVVADNVVPGSQITVNVN